MTTPWRHQQTAIDFAAKRDTTTQQGGTLLAMRPGTGKSLTAIKLAGQWQSQAVLILCPVAVLAVWRREFFRHGDAGWDILILDKGSVSHKGQQAARFAESRRVIGRPFVIVINIEAAWREPLANWLLGQRWDLTILDESHRFKNPRGKAAKFSHGLAARSRRRLCLSGTPLPHSPLDAWSQFRFLDARIFGTNFWIFKQRYAIANKLFPSKVDRWINQEEFRAKLASATVFVSEDALDLPQAMHDSREIELAPAETRAYLSMRDELLLDIEGGDSAPAERLIADNSLVKYLRLQQITSGYVETESGGVVVLGDSKRDALADLLEDIDPAECVVVFCRFKPDLARVRKIAETLGRRYGELSGASKDLNEHAMIPEGFQIFGVQIQSGGIGVDFTRAAYCVFYSIGFSLADYDQALARVVRPGQGRHVTFYHLIATNTIDEDVYRALQERSDLIQAATAGLRRGGEFETGRGVALPGVKPKRRKA